MQERTTQRIIHVVRWVVLASVVGAISGLLSAAFIKSLNWASTTRVTHNWLIYLLPLAGLVIGLSYHYLGRGLERGSNLLIDQIHEHTEWIPFRLTPLIFINSVITHLFGGSAGREGAALQLAVGATDPISKRLGFPPADRSIMIIAAIAGGFGSVFGVPVAGAVFALEVQRVGRVRYDAILPAFTASFVGDAIVHAVGVHHTAYPPLPSFTWSPSLAWRIILLGLISGLVSMLFVWCTHSVKHVMSRYLSWYPLRPMVGGVLIAAAVLMFRLRDYQGLSVPIALAAFGGAVGGMWLAKLLLTSLTIGSGFVGGEVIPLFVMGALLGASIGHITGGNVALFAIVGSVAVLAGAANTPLACTLLGIELFGGNGAVLFAAVCVASYITSGHKGIYHAQKISAHKAGANN
jgi:H+/Cl- antiporter ClcA